jgi:hypothetical protein
MKKVYELHGANKWDLTLPIFNLAIIIVLGILMANLKAMNKVIGRKRGLELLKKLKDNESPIFLAVYGRRRVG